MTIVSLCIKYMASRISGYFSNVVFAILILIKHALWHDTRKKIAKSLQKQLIW